MPSKKCEMRHEKYQAAGNSSLTIHDCTDSRTASVQHQTVIQRRTFSLQAQSRPPISFFPQHNQANAALPFHSTFSIVVTAKPVCHYHEPKPPIPPQHKRTHKKRGGNLPPLPMLV
jgi:hypothetical protein